MRLKFISILLIIFFCSLSFACSSKKKEKKYNSPNGYDFNNPTVIHLKSELDEISGLSYYEKDNSIFAICDEYGILYKLILQKPIHIEKWKFSSSGDFEDITLIDSAFYALKSNGEINSFSFSDNKPQVKTVTRINPSGSNEFESLYFDSGLNKLIILCKDCADDNNKQNTAYQFNPLTGVFENKPLYTLQHNLIKKAIGPNKNFKPSATAIHPLTQEVYIISAIANALVIADKSGTVKNIFKLDPKLFKQPEGMTFSPNGTLYISNEAADAGSSNILVFTYKN